MVKEGYKETEIGVIPEDWNICQLGDVVSFKNGVAHENSITQNGRYIVVNSKFVSTEGNIKRYSNLCLQPCYENDILMVMSDVPNGRAIAKCFYVSENGMYTLNQRICALTTKTSEAKYIYYAINRHPYFLSFDDGVKQTNLTKNNILECKLCIPAKDEQQKIAEALSDMDNLVSSLEKLIEKKKAIKQGAMQELLTGKKRLPGFSGEWCDIKLGDCCEIYDGTHQTPNYTEYGMPFYSVENVTADDFANTKYISFEEHELLNKNRRMEKGDVLMTRIGSIGDCKYIDWDVNASFYVSLALIKCKKKISGQFLSYYSHTEKFKKEIEIRSLLTAIPQKINLGPISEIVINVPADINEQNAITEIIFDMDNEISTLEQKLAKCQKLKQGMMQQLLTGKIRLI